MIRPLIARRSPTRTAEPPHSVVFCSTAIADWDWLPDSLLAQCRQWYFSADPVHVPWYAQVPWLGLHRLRASWRAIRCLHRHGGRLLITGDAQSTFWCALFAGFLRVRAYHVALSFRLPQAPRGFQGLFAQWLYAGVDQVIVHSRAEQRLYSQELGIPQQRLTMTYWGSAPPLVQPATPLVSGEYVSIWVDGGVDYARLKRAIAALPMIPFVIVTGDRDRVPLPSLPNVQIYRATTLAQRMNVLHYARFVVHPLASAYQPCDYQMLVAAMHLGKALVLPELPTLSDYAFHNANAVLYPLGEAEALAIAIQTLWTDVVRCEILGTNGRDFARTFCSDATRLKNLQPLLLHAGRW